MSRIPHWSDPSEMKKRDAEREELRGDIAYRLWRADTNPDTVDIYRAAEDAYYGGYTADDAVARILRAQRQARERAEERRSEEEPEE